MAVSTVFACESQPIVVEGLIRVFGSTSGFALIGSCCSVNTALPMIEQDSPAIVLLDQASGFKSLLQYLPEVKASSPGSHSVLWASYISDTDAFRAVQCGARAVIRKSSPVSTLLECLRHVAAGEIWIENSQWNERLDPQSRKSTPRLTARELEILRCVHSGMKNRDIADALAITPGTVKVHLMHIFEKTGVKDRFELAVLANRLLLEPRMTSEKAVRDSL